MYIAENQKKIYMSEYLYNLTRLNTFANILQSAVGFGALLYWRDSS